MMQPFSLEALAQAQVARMAALLTVGTVIAVGGAVAFRLSSRFSAAARYALVVSVLVLLLVVAIRPESVAVGDGSQGVFHSVYVSPLWSELIFVAWALVAFAALMRVAVGIYRVRRLKREATAIAPESLPVVVRESLKTARRLGTPVELIASESLKTPAAVGFFRPAVVLPSWMVNHREISEDDLHALVLHELAHISRYDDWMNLAQKIAKAILFFHPAAWWLDRRIAAEREMACDDAVVRSAKDPQRYAECLVRMAEHNYVRRALALAQAAVGHARLTTIRVKRLLALPGAAPSGWKAGLIGTALACVGIAAAVSPVPQLVTFAKPYGTTANSQATLGNSNVILARSASLTTDNSVALHSQDPALAAARTKRKSAHALAVRHDHSAPTNSYWLVIETRQQIVGDSVVQTETWRVVMISSPPAMRRAVPNKEI
jgi:beta-lactamase regulating signal transducer with metallopeptidase domain